MRSRFDSQLEKLNQEIQLCDTQIKELQQQLAVSNDPAENEALVHQLDRLHQQQQNNDKNGFPVRHHILKNSAHSFFLLLLFLLFAV